REITRQSVTAGTEELRQALLSYRVLFRDLIAPGPSTERPAGAAKPAAPDHKTPAAPITGNSTASAHGDTTAGAAEPETSAHSGAAQGGTAANAHDAERRTGAERHPRGFGCQAAWEVWPGFSRCAQAVASS
ncbi:MAG: hypothetical protein J2P30_24015, partial [Actinobacteria bacterium]|nr:hypothetical protein [Actinomycetota bacterium]